MFTDAAAASDGEVATNSTALHNTCAATTFPASYCSTAAHFASTYYTGSNAIFAASYSAPAAVSPCRR
jgi:hypothetical protein